MEKYAVTTEARRGPLVTVAFFDYITAYGYYVRACIERGLVAEGYIPETLLMVTNGAQTVDLTGYNHLLDYPLNDYDREIGEYVTIEFSKN
jgi:hypothetical protein